MRRGALCDDGKVDTSQMVGPNLLGALTYFDLISTMCVLALVIPNFSRSTTEANFSTPVNVVLSVVALGVYAVFISAQMGRYSNLYTERKSLIIRDTESPSRPRLKLCRCGRPQRCWWLACWWCA